jgi:enoyl-CoA hydratase
MPVTVSVADRIAEIVFDHPPVNAFDTAQWAALPDLISQAGSREDVRCVLLRAEGRGFCGGVDIKEMAAHPERIVQLNRDNHRTFLAIRHCPVPVVSAIHGFAIGGGVNIAGASDVLLAAEGAYFSLPEIDRGAMGGAAFMMRMLPLHKVRAAFFTGGKVTVEEAHQLGAVEQVVPLADLAQTARDYCAVIAGKSRTALVLAKQALNGLEATDPNHGYRFEQGFTLEMYMHPDSQAARDAFVDGKAAAKF